MPLAVVCGFQCWAVSYLFEHRFSRVVTNLFLCMLSVRPVVIRNDDHLPLPGLCMSFLIQTDVIPYRFMACNNLPACSN